MENQMGAVESEDNGCPTCGSQSVKRVAGPDEQSDDVVNLDEENSGTYLCERCGAYHYYEQARRPELKSIPYFSPTARCPKCRSYNTRTRSTNPQRKERNHECRDCDNSFWTKKSDT